MHSKPITAASWNQGQYDASTGTYSGTTGMIASDPIEIPFGCQTLSFSGEGYQKIVLKEWKYRTEGDMRIPYSEEPYISTETIVYYALFDKDMAQLKSIATISRGGTANISAYPTAAYIIISIEAASHGIYYNYNLYPTDEDCVAAIEGGSSSNMRALVDPVEMGLTYYLWTMQDDGFYHSDEADVFPVYMQVPYPEAMWRIIEGYNNGFPFNELLPNIPITKGAFEGAENLEQVKIPPSVKEIGEKAFADTALTEVTIAEDCTYYGTSFPQDCVINIYPE